MPTHGVFETYARRVEQEMSPAKLKEKKVLTSKMCASCGAECALEAKACHECDNEFAVKVARIKVCDCCQGLNPIGAQSCQTCSTNFQHDFEITLDDALRAGAIIRGMDFNEGEIAESEAMRDTFRRDILASGDQTLIKIIRQIPEESYSRLARILDDARR
jgi:ribosomal protein L40E